MYTYTYVGCIALAPYVNARNGDASSHVFIYVYASTYVTRVRAIVGGECMKNEAIAKMKGSLRFSLGREKQQDH